MQSCSPGRSRRPPSGTAVRRAPGAPHLISRPVERGERCFRRDFARRRCQGQHTRLRLARRPPRRSSPERSLEVRQTLIAAGAISSCDMSGCSLTAYGGRSPRLCPTASSAIASGSCSSLHSDLPHSLRRTHSSSYNIVCPNSQPAVTMNARGLPRASEPMPTGILET